MAIPERSILLNGNDKQYIPYGRYGCIKSGSRTQVFPIEE